MAHTTNISSTTTIIHNSDFSDLIVVKDKWGGQVSIPFEDIKKILASKYRNDLISHMEDANADNVINTMITLRDKKLIQ
jgi:hypothetical protein